jgi:SAM-dependent methyltransferase
MSVDVVLTGEVADELRRREARAFEEGAAAYDRAMADAGRAARHQLLELAELGPGLSLLDVCTGPGWLAIDGAAVCTGGRVVGIDLSSQMVALARSNAATAGVPGVEFAVMDAQALEFDDAPFDRVVCGLGLMHAPDPRSVLAEMARVSQPSARVALSVWGSADETFFGTLAAALRVGAGGRLPLDYGYVTRLGEPGVLEQLLIDAGWTRPVPRRFEGFGGVVPSAEIIWAGVTAGGTTFATLVADLPAIDRQHVHDEFVERCEVFRQSDGLHIPTTQLLATAIR